MKIMNWKDKFIFFKDKISQLARMTFWRYWFWLIGLILLAGLIEIFFLFNRYALDPAKTDKNYIGAGINTKIYQRVIDRLLEKERRFDSDFLPASRDVFR